MGGGKKGEGGKIKKGRRGEGAIKYSSIPKSNGTLINRSARGVIAYSKGQALIKTF